MFDFFKLKSPIGRSYNTDPDDVLQTKKVLNGLGYYDEPAHGITPYPDTSLIRGIEAFQRDHGLKPDGLMKPDGETMWMLGSVITDTFQNARNLQSLGRNGDTILAHISPKEVMMLKSKGGAGTVHPVTGLLEFSDDAKNGGKYIWHTAGDGKVRSSHADRDGKTFSWDNPPEGGHPGEAPNCRCTAEDVPEEDVKCKELKHMVENQEITVREALKDWERIQKEHEDANELQRRQQDQCRDAFVEGGAKTLIGIGTAGITGGPGGAIRGGGEAAITSAGTIYDACSEADEQLKKVQELKERSNMALEYLEEQRKILNGLREKLANSGCKL